MTARVTPAQYDLFLTGQQKFIALAPMIVFLVMPIIFFVVFSQLGDMTRFTKEAPAFFPYFPFGFLLIIAVAYAWTLTSLTYRISVTQDQKLVFKSWRNAHSVRVADLVSIEPRSLHIQMGVSGYVATHRDGKIRFPGQFTGMYRLLYELKQANPALQIQGI